MSRPKICVYAIAKNEEAFVDRWMDSVGEADLVAVTDTGSTDGTAERLRARGAVVYEETVKPWRFDKARNIALGHLPEDADICVSNDLDEVFEKGWRQKLEAAWQPDCTSARYLFTFSFHPDGTPAVQYPMEKIHRRHGFRWVRPVHEILEYTGDGEEKSVWVDGLVLGHHPDLSKPRAQYLPLLELSVEENPQDDRAMFWLGREYYYHREYDRCIGTLTRHLELPGAAWDEERCASMRLIAACHEAKGQPVQAKSWLLRAVAECPRVREPYLAAAGFGYRTGDWPLVCLMTSEGLKITQRTGSYLNEPECFDGSLEDYAAIGCYYLGLYRESYEYARRACGLRPEDRRLRENLRYIQEKLG